MSGDNQEAAESASEAFRDCQVEHGWDAEQRVSMLFAKVLNLDSLAWDVYLLYGPGVTWTGQRPPDPTFWMHQLPAHSGAHDDLLLHPGRLAKQLSLLLGREPEQDDQDRAFLLHTKGLATVRDAKVQASMKEVERAVGPLARRQREGNEQRR